MQIDSIFKEEDLETSIKTSYLYLYFFSKKYFHSCKNILHIYPPLDPTILLLVMFPKDTPPTIWKKKKYIYILKTVFSYNCWIYFCVRFGQEARKMRTKEKKNVKDNRNNPYWFLICAKKCAKYFTCINSLNISTILSTTL